MRSPHPHYLDRLLIVPLRYCNHRILKFDAVGSLLETWDKPVHSVPLFIPHKLALSRDQTTLFVADRENRRVLTYNTHTGASRVFSDSLDLAVYAIYTNGSYDWPMYGVFGGEPGSMGFTLSKEGELVTTWGPAGVSQCVCVCVGGCGCGCTSTVCS